MIEWIVSSAVLILVIAVVRQLLKGKISLQLQYALWAIVLVRLLVPISFGQSKISIQNVVQAEQTVQTEQGESAETPGITIDIPPSRGDYVAPDLSVVEPDPSLSEEEQELQYEQNVQQWQDELDADWEKYKAENTRHVTLSATDVFYLIWIAGMAVTAIIFAVSNLRFVRRLRRSRRPMEADCRLPVYVSGAVETPCLFGLFRPAVYVTPEVAEDEVALGHVLAHEETHCVHGDHIWALLRSLCLVIHWYNPLVWMAAALSRRDAELACDAGAIRRIGEEERAAYGRTLIGLTCAHRGNLLHTATTMTGSKKSIKERIVLIAKKPKMAVYTLVAVILIAAVAVGCTFTGAVKIPLVKQLQKLEEESVDWIILSLDSESYTVSEDEYNEVLAVLRGITEEQCLGEVEFPGVNYALTVHAGDESWYFVVADQEEYGSGVAGYYDEASGENDWLWIDSPELYQYIIDRFNREKNEESEPPAFVQATAEFQMELRRAHVEQEYLMIGMTHEVLAELKGLTRLELGTAGLDWAVEMWKMDYDITVAAGQEANTTADTLWLVVLYDYTTEKYIRFLGSMDEKTLNYTYNTPEMIDKYGDMYRAAAMELYGQYGEEASKLNAPVSPSDGLYNLTKRGNTVSLTLHTKEGGAQRTFFLDYQSDAWRTTNLRTGVSWNLLSEAPEGDWDYWLTYLSADGTASITFYAGENGPVCYRDEQRTIWWTERGGTPDAETLREEVYDPLDAEQTPPAGLPNELVTSATYPSDPEEYYLVAKLPGQRIWLYARNHGEKTLLVYGDTILQEYDHIAHTTHLNLPKAAMLDDTHLAVISEVNTGTQVGVDQLVVYDLEKLNSYVYDWSTVAEEFNRGNTLVYDKESNSFTLTFDGVNQVYTTGSLNTDMSTYLDLEDGFTGTVIASGQIVRYQLNGDGTITVTMQTCVGKGNRGGFDAEGFWSYSDYYPMSAGADGIALSWNISFEQGEFLADTDSISCSGLYELVTDTNAIQSVVDGIFVGALSYDAGWQSMGNYTVTSTGADGRTDTYVGSPRTYYSLSSTPGNALLTNFRWTQVDEAQWTGMAENDYALRFANDRYAVTIYTNENKLKLEANGITQFFVGTRVSGTDGEYSGVFNRFREYAENALQEYEYAVCQVSGSETDYAVIARKLAEQYAQIILKRPGWAAQQALDAQVKGTEVFDAYYGSDNPNFCFGKGLYLKVTEDQRWNWEVGAGLEGPFEEGDYKGWYGHGMQVGVRKMEDGNWHMTGMGTGGAMVSLPVWIDDATTEQLMELYFLTEGETHDWRILYRLAEKPLEEVAAQLKQLETAQRRELTSAITTLIEEYPEYAAWTAEDFLAASDGGT